MRARLRSPLALFIAALCASAARGAEPKSPLDWPTVGRIALPALSECSGIVKSVKHHDIFWTHNDSDQPATLFAIKLTGEVVAQIPVVGATNVDWEDIAIDGDGKLYIADIGDNFLRRKSYTIYELPEPDPFAKPRKPVQVEHAWHFSFPTGSMDSEAIFIRDGELYLITKQTRVRPTLFHLKRLKAGTLTPEPVCTVPLAPITAADVSADGKKLAVISYGQLAVFDLAGGLASVEKAEPERIAYPPQLQTEACCFDGDDVIIAAESRQIWRVTAAEIAAGHREFD